MRRYKGVIVLVVLAVESLLFTGCERWLNIAPKGNLIPETVKDFSLILNGSDITKVSDGQALYLTDDVYLLPEGDMYGIDVQAYMGKPQGRMYTFAAEGYYAESDYCPYYDAAYSRVYIYNTIINYVLQAAGDDAQARQVRAEALCGRAMEYLLLINLFAPHYDPATAASTYGVPLMLTTDLEVTDIQKASVAEVYAQVEADLEEAVADLPATPAHGTALRFSRPAALAYMAKSAFLKGEWAAALKRCEEVLAVRNELHNWTEEEILDPLSLTSTFPKLIDNKENILLRYSDAYYGIGFTTYCPPSVLSLFDITNDMRYVLQFSDNMLGNPLSDPSLRFYIRPLGFNTGISTSDIYLMAAECKVRTGDVEGGIALINTLRDHRIKGNTPLPVGSQEEALRLVLEERRRELYNHSVERLIDIKRLSKDPSTRVVVRHELPGGAAVEIDGNDRRLVLPIPPKVLQFNPDMMPRGGR